MDGAHFVSQPFSKDEKPRLCLCWTCLRDESHPEPPQIASATLRFHGVAYISSQNCLKYSLTYYLQHSQNPLQHPRRLHPQILLVSLRLPPHFPPRLPSNMGRHRRRLRASRNRQGRRQRTRPHEGLHHQQAPDAFARRCRRKNDVLYQRLV